MYNEEHREPEGPGGLGTMGVRLVPLGASPSNTMGRNTITSLRTFIRAGINLSTENCWIG